MDIDEQIAEISSPSLNGVEMIELCGKNQIQMDSEMADLITPKSKDLGLQTVGSMPRTWTNEKHSLYLNTMEASFIKRLHSHEYHSMRMPGQQSGLNNLQDRHMSLNANANDHKSSNQFKVLQSGCWKTISFESAEPKMNIADNSHIHIENQRKNSFGSTQPKMNIADDNQWIRRFKCAGKHQELASPSLQENSSSQSSKRPEFALPNLQENCGQNSECQESPNLRENGAQSSTSVCSERQKLEYCEPADQQDATSSKATTSKKLQPRSHQRGQDYISNSTVPSLWLFGSISPYFGESSETNHTEVSDQNFIDEDNGESHIRNHQFGNKKRKMTTSEGLCRDQIVPNKTFSVVDSSGSEGGPNKGNVMLFAMSSAPWRTEFVDKKNAIH